MPRLLLSIFLTLFISIGPGLAQNNTSEVAWVQLEAQPSLTAATERARAYAADLQDVNGFSLGSGWYSVALGPYTPEDAQTVLRVYRAERLIPRDSYVTASTAFKSQFWPVGADLLAPTVPVQTGQEPTPAVTTPDETISDETPRQARTSEAKLSREERKTLQRWLKWAGYYNSAIDGAFGRGTRNSMSNWQADNRFDVTGILTTRQRDVLRRQYYAVLDGMGLKSVTNTDAGIQMLLPTGVVALAKSEFPFVHYDASKDLTARVLLISQAGDQNTLFGLYDIMQTLEIVPLEGPRERKNKSFVLTGIDEAMISHTEVSLKNGKIKGFTLIWPVGDEERRTRILGEMKSSFTRIDGVLDPAAGSNAAQSIDLVSGLEIRKPKLSRSGFFIDRNGAVVTTVEAITNCTKITLNSEYEASVVGRDDTLGIAVLKPTAGLAPMSVANLLDGDARLQSEIAIAGFSFEGILGAPTMTFGRLEDLKGLNGDTNLKRLTLAALPGDAGGPVFDTSGSVLGMLLPNSETSTKRLPEGVRFAAGTGAIRSVLDQAGVAFADTTSGSAMPAEELMTHASDLTVLVSCW